MNTPTPLDPGPSLRTLHDAPARVLAGSPPTRRGAHGRRPAGRPLGLAAGLLLAGALAASGARADGTGGGVAGVCPDGSFFVVASRSAAPCASPKFVPASELPPIRPQYLPKPYTWYVDQEERDENNPYNLVDKAQAMRELRRGEREPEASGRAGGGRSEAAPEPTQNSVGGAGMPAPAGPDLELTRDELRDLVQLIALRQEAAPAVLPVEDVRGELELQLKFAYSPAFERQVLEALDDAGGAAAGDRRVVAFAVRSERRSEFYPRFFVTQDGESYRPAAGERGEQGFVLGAAGEMEAGVLSIGYFVLPARFDPARAMTIWWNDRDLEVVLDPGPEVPEAPASPRAAAGEEPSAVALRRS